MRAENVAVAPLAGGLQFPQEPIKKLYNRTGGATVKYGIYRCDTDLQTAVESVVNSKGVLLPAVTDFGDGPSGAFGNFIITPSSITTGSGSTDATSITGGVWCVAQEVVADNELCDVIFIGRTFINATTTGLTSAPGTIIAGRRILPALGVATAEVAGGNAGAAKIVGMTIASGSWAASSTVVAVECYFNGINGAFGR